MSAWEISKTEILQRKPLKLEAIEVPEWRNEAGEPATVYVRPMTVAEREAMANHWRKYVENGHANEDDETTARILSACWVDAEGRQLFPGAEMRLIKEFDGTVLQRIFERARDISGFGPKSVEDIAKNSQPSTSAVSGSS